MSDIMQWAKNARFGWTPARPVIVTSFQYTPIPVRDHDWCAHYEGEEEDGN